MDDIKRDIFLRYAWSFVGTRYSWGGDDPLGGFDCSGLVIELLTALGMWPSHKDATAQGLHDYFEGIGRQGHADIGSLVFYGKDSNSITHVSIVIAPGFIIEAGGGGSKTQTLQDAINQNAFIRIRPIGHRQKEIVAVVMPNY